MSLNIGMGRKMTNQEVKAHHAKLMGDQSMPGQMDESAIMPGNRPAAQMNPTVGRKIAPAATHAGRVPIDLGHLKWHSGKGPK